MAKFKIAILILAGFVLGGFFLRVWLVPAVNKGDVLVNGEWSRSVYRQGLAGVYFRQGWTYSFPTQPPLMMLCFWMSSWLFEHRYVLALVHNWIRIPPAAWLLWLDKYGELVAWRWWAIWGDLLSGILVYWVVGKETKKKWLGLVGAAAVIFNPVAVFVSGIWGQNDVWAVFWVYLAFFLFESKRGKWLSPVLWMVGVLMKPTVLILVPVYLVFVVRRWVNGGEMERRRAVRQLIVGSILAVVVIVVSFVPFWERQAEFLPFVRSVVVDRILPSAKGASRASVSAFNLYSLFFDIDTTLASYSLGGVSLDVIGIVGFWLTVGGVGFWGWRRWGEKKRGRGGLIWGMYFLGEGAFLFRTGMVERYFFLAFPATIMLAVLVAGRARWWLGFQQLIWLVNLMYAFFWRDSSWVNWWFRENGFLLTRVFSFLNLLIYFLILVEVRRRRGGKKLLVFGG